MGLIEILEQGDLADTLVPACRVLLGVCVCVCVVVFGEFAREHGGDVDRISQT
jgi:hypothetical protein